MALNVSSWSIRKPLPSIVVSLSLLIMGAISFFKLPITQYPNVDIPVIAVTVTEFGASPVELELQVTKAIEDAVSGVEGVRHIDSAITDGVSTTAVLFRLETNTDRALNDVKDAVTRARATLPASIDEPLIQRVRCRRTGYRDLRGDCARKDAGTTLLVRDGCYKTQAAKRSGRGEN